MYSSEYTRGYNDGFKAGVQSVTQPPKSNATLGWERILNEYYELEKREALERQKALEEEEYERTRREFLDTDSDSSSWGEHEVEDSRYANNACRNPYDESSSDDNDEQKNDTIYRTFDTEVFKSAKDMVPHISVASQWSTVVTEDNMEHLAKEVQKICLVAREKKDVSTPKKVGTHQERKKTKKLLRKRWKRRRRYVQ